MTIPECSSCYLPSDIDTEARGRPAEPGAQPFSLSDSMSDVGPKGEEAHPSADGENQFLTIQKLFIANQILQKLHQLRRQNHQDGGSNLC